MLPKLYWASALIALVTLAIAMPASAVISASGVYQSAPNGPNYDYNILLHNTGTTQIKTFWFSWLPYSSFLPSIPNSEGAPAGWSGQIVQDTYGNSILWSTTGSGIAPGASLFGFTLNTADSPTTLAGVDQYFGFYPVTFSYIYADTVASPNAVLPGPPGSLTLSPGVVPEPGSLALFTLGTLLMWRTRRR